MNNFLALPSYSNGKVSGGLLILVASAYALNIAGSRQKLLPGAARVSGFFASV